MKKLLLILLCLPMIGFGQQTIEEALRIWKEELYSNKEVGPPCDENGDYHKWFLENPDYYWGLQELKEVREDFNNDGIQDAFVFFPAENCIGGNGTGSDFSALIFSDSLSYQRYTHLSSALEEYLRGHKGIVGYDDIRKIVVSYNIEINNRKTDVEGRFYAWTNGDAQCCPSISRKFSIDLNKIANNSKFNRLAIQMKPKD